MCSSLLEIVVASIRSLPPSQNKIKRLIHIHWDLLGKMHVSLQLGNIKQLSLKVFQVAVEFDDKF